MMRTKAGTRDVVKDNPSVPLRLAMVLGGLLQRVPLVRQSVSVREFYNHRYEERCFYLPFPTLTPFFSGIKIRRSLLTIKMQCVRCLWSAELVPVLSDCMYRNALLKGVPCVSSRQTMGA